MKIKVEVEIETETETDGEEQHFLNNLDLGDLFRWANDNGDVVGLHIYTYSTLADEKP